MTFYTGYTGTREGRMLSLEDPTATGRRDLVVALREADAYPLPLPAWEADDENGLVMLCRAGEVPLASVRLVVHRCDDAGDWGYLPAEMVSALPSGAERIAFCERLVTARGARSLDLLALLLHVTAIVGVERLGIRDYAAVVRPATERLIEWFGGRRLTGPLELPGLGITGVLMAGDMAVGARHAGVMLAARGWTVARHEEANAPPVTRSPRSGQIRGQGQYRLERIEAGRYPGVRPDTGHESTATS